MYIKTFQFTNLKNKAKRIHFMKISKNFMVVYLNKYNKYRHQGK